MLRPSDETPNAKAMHHFALTASVHPSPRRRLLVVDDEQVIRELHALVLSLDGYDVETAEDGVAALERLATEPFDLVLTDRHMPNLDGVSLVLALRSAGSRIPVVMVSSSLTHTPLPPAVDREISAALPKPARTAEVLSAVARALHPAPPRESARHSEGVHLGAA
ncbi:MAG: two-component system, response regulator, stage 0 sporulation protein [Chthoniobacter sp.]|jgi:CheY-like chemotaxis protein|nr:two-component system, response regulator, stage 0 sporulation protein [Chthoniobacter sp.]